MALLGPAFVAAIAYVDPGNVATNTTAGSQYAYVLVWVVVVSNFFAILVQYLSAKLGIATGKSLPHVCRENYSRPVASCLWLQAEAVALATDLAEVLGGAIALHLLFDISLLTGGLITGAVSFCLLFLQSRGHRPFERAIVLLLLVIVVGFMYAAVVAGPEPGAVASGLVPAFDGSASVLIATGILGATVMPHAIYLHSALAADRVEPRKSNAQGRLELLRATRVDVVVAMTIAGAVNLSMLVMAAAALHGSGTRSIEGVHAALDERLGGVVALVFALALLASGFASTSVGTVAGSVILEGFLRRRISLVMRRVATLAPALLLLAVGVDPTNALILSQVVLSFGIPFALIPLVHFTSDRGLMGTLVNRRAVTVTAVAIACVISLLNVLLLWLTFLEL